MKRNFIFFGLLLILSTFYLINAQTKAKLIVNVDGFKNDNGMVRIALFNDKSSFPMKGEKAIKVDAVQIKNKKAVFILEGLDYGEYAASVFHDENNDGKLNTNFLGIPKESVGASNNAKGSFGPPSYEDAKFIVNENVKTIQIKMQ